MQSKEYNNMQLEFKRFFNQGLTDYEIEHKKGGIKKHSSFLTLGFLSSVIYDVIHY